MTQKETIDNANKVIQILNGGGYIKGHGPGKFRLMDASHNPVINFGSQTHGLLTYETRIKQKDIFWIGASFNMSLIPYPEKTKKRR